MKRKAVFYVLLGLSLWLRFLNPIWGGMLLALWILKTVQGEKGPCNPSNPLLE